MTVTRSITLDQLDDLHIAAPCHVRWEDMTGDDRVRHCADCDLDVYDFSEMTRDEIVEFIETSDGRVCAQLYRRADGTIMTRDCPVGLRALRQVTVRRMRRMGIAAGLVVAGVISSVVGGSERLRRFQPFAKIAESVTSAPPPPIAIRGEVCLPAPNQPTGTGAP